MRKYLLTILLFVVLSFGVVKGEGLIQVIDMPTANSVELGSFVFNTRLYGQGSVLLQLYYGIIMEDLTLGLSFDAENVIGSNDIEPRRPYLYLKFPLYRGTQKWPAVSIGFDEQGLGAYNEDTDEYRFPPAGFFMAITKKGLMSGLNLTVGINSNYSLVDSIQDKLFGFSSIDFMVGPEFMLLAEVRDIELWNSYLSGGAKYFLTPELDFEFSVINLTNRKTDAERILKVTYSKVWGGF